MEVGAQEKDFVEMMVTAVMNSVGVAVDKDVEADADADAAAAVGDADAGDAAPVDADADADAAAAAVVGVQVLTTIYKVQDNVQEIKLVLSVKEAKSVVNKTHALDQEFKKALLTTI